MANHLPPYMIISETEGQSHYRGFDFELAELIADKLKIDTEYVDCEWQDCMRMLKNGDMDMANSILHAPSRVQFLDYLTPSYLGNDYQTVFFQRFDDTKQINSMDDLYQKDMVVGYVGVFVYFPEFDNDHKMLKMDVKDRHTGLRLLASGKIDVLAGYSQLFDAMKFDNPNIGKLIKTAPYQPGTEMVSYTAVSKNSDNYHLKSSISKALIQLSQQGTLKQLQEKWFNPKADLPVLQKQHQQ